MAARAEAIARSNRAKQSAWKHLSTHYKDIRNLHLRQLFADDPQRGVRLTVQAAGIYLDYSKNRITDETLKLLIRLAEESGCGSESTRCFAVRKSTSLKIERSCTLPFVHHGIHRSSSMARTWCPKCMRCSIAWRHSRPGAQR